MDAVKFVKEYLRMCTKVDECEDCPVYKTDFCTVPARERSQESAEEIVELVEEWAAAHPRKTRQTTLLEQYPEAEIDSRGCLMLCPKRISADYQKRYRNCTSRLCSDCRKEFWGQEVE